MVTQEAKGILNKNHSFQCVRKEAMISKDGSSTLTGVLALCMVNLLLGGVLSLELSVEE